MVTKKRVPVGRSKKKQLGIYVSFPSHRLVLRDKSYAMMRSAVTTPTAEMTA